MDHNEIKYCLFPNEENKLCDEKCKYYNTCAKRKIREMKDFVSKK